MAELFEIQLMLVPGMMYMPRAQMKRPPYRDVGSWTASMMMYPTMRHEKAKTRKGKRSLYLSEICAAHRNEMAARMYTGTVRS